MKLIIVDYNSGNISSIINSFREVAQNKVNIEEVYQDLAQKMLDGKLEQPIDSIYRLEELEDAIKRSTQEGRNGKVLLKFKS